MGLASSLALMWAWTLAYPPGRESAGVATRRGWLAAAPQKVLSLDPALMKGFRSAQGLAKAPSLRLAPRLRLARGLLPHGWMRIRKAAAQ